MISLQELIDTLQFATGVDIGSLMSGGIIAVLVGATVVEFIPKIKLKPWTWVLGYIGKALNKEMLDKMKGMDAELKEVRKDVDAVKKEVGERFDKTDKTIERNEIINSRVRILRFVDEIGHGLTHSKEHFDQIMRDIDQYERYCDSHPDFENNVTTISIARIKHVYASRLERNDWD